MPDLDIEPDLIQEGIRRAKYREAVENLRFLANTAWFAVMSIPILLALILWRIW
jgi:hypothetical protein